MNNAVRQFFASPWAELIGRWFLGIMFVSASIHKIMEPAQFAKIIYGYQLVPDDAINLIAIILPFLELFSGAALLVGIYPKSAALIINTMLLVFIVAILINVFRGHVFDCGCFAIADTDHQSAALALFIRDVVSLAVGIYVMVYRGSPKWHLFQHQRPGSLGQDFLP